MKGKSVIITVTAGDFEYIDEWETSVSVSPSLLPTSSKYVCMHDFWP